MGIDTVGTSLLAKAKKATKKREKNQLIGSFAELGGKLLKRGVESIFETKRKEFEKTEGIMAEKIKYKSAVANGTQIINEQTLISESGKSGQQYFYDQMEDTHRANMLAVTDPKISGNEKLFDQFIKSTLTPLATKRALKHDEGYTLAGTLGTFEEFNAETDARIKKVRPETIADSLIGGAVRLFSGKSKAEQEEEVLDSIRKGVMSKSAEAMNAFNERYKETKNVLMSFDYANAIAAEDLEKIANEELDTVVSTKDTIIPLGDKLFSTTETSTVTRRGRVDAKTNVTVSAPVEITSWTDPDDELGRAKSMTSSFNLAKDARAMMTPDAFTAYMKEVSGAGYNAINIQTVVNYGEVANIFNEYTQNKANLKDKFKDDIITTTMSTFNQNSLNLGILEASLKLLEKDSPAHKEKMDEIRAEKESWFTYSVAISDYSIEQTRKNTTIPNSEGVDAAIWNDASDIDKQKMNQMSQQELIDNGFITK